MDESILEQRKERREAGDAAKTTRFLIQNVAKHFPAGTFFDDDEPNHGQDPRQVRQNDQNAIANRLRRSF